MEWFEVSFYLLLVMTTLIDPTIEQFILEAFYLRTLFKTQHWVLSFLMVTL